MLKTYHAFPFFHFPNAIIERSIFSPELAADLVARVAVGAGHVDQLPQHGRQFQRGAAFQTITAIATECDKPWTRGFLLVGNFWVEISRPQLCHLEINVGENVPDQILAVLVAMVFLTLKE